MTDATELDEAAVRARVEAATEGPWRVVVDHHRGYDVPEVSVWSDAVGAYVTEDVVVGDSQFPANAEFVAHARTDVPLLLAALDEAREQADSFSEQLLAERHDHERTRAAKQALSERAANDLLAAESALATIRTLARSWSGRNDLLMTGDSAAHDIEAALAAPTTTERSEG